MRKAYSYIRFSSKVQAKGDSLRRQLEASRNYADEHGLALDDSMVDMGVSAWTGDNAATGALSDFLKLVESGTIEKGSVLILESLDRLSRQQVLKTLSLFTGILAAGIDIVTLADRQTYTADSINDTGQLMFSIMTMSRAHQESDVKSQRLSASWKQKRKLAIDNHTPMTARCPWWLELRPDRSGYDAVPERVEIVRSIFRDTIGGIGRRIIATKLNEAGVEPIGDGKRKGRQWHASIIAKTLENRSVLGEFQPCRKHDRMPIGEPIRGYYPAVVDEATFYKAQQAVQSRRVAGGRKGKRFGNLLTGCCKCVECGGTVRYQDKGPKPKGGQYLYCDSSHMKSGCSNKKRWRYDFVESAALLVLADTIDWTAVYGGDDGKRGAIENALTVEQGKLELAERTRDRYQALFIDASDAMLAEATTQYQSAVDAVSLLKNTIKKHEAALSAYTPAQRSIDSLEKAFGKLGVDGTYEDRAHVNSLLKAAGLELWFCDAGVVWRIGKQKGVLIDGARADEVGDAVMLAAALAKTNYAVDEMMQVVEAAEAERKRLKEL